MIQLDIVMPRQSGKSLMVAGIVKQTVETLKRKEAALVIYRTEHHARDAVKRWDLWPVSVAWTRWDQSALMGRINSADVIIMEDWNTWSIAEHQAVACLLNARRERDHQNKTRPCTLIVTQGLPDFS